MRAFALASALAAASVVSANPTSTEKDLPARAASLPTVTASGNALYADGKRFYIRGIDYQPGGSSANIDPLADPEVCGRDIPKFKALGVNTVRVYSVSNNKDHDECMGKLADAGIYVVADVNSPHFSIRRDKPAPSYNAAYLQSVFATIDALAKYTNTLAFFSGNEVIDRTPGSTKTAPYVKATTRDMRQYISSRGYRRSPWATRPLMSATTACKPLNISTAVASSSAATSSPSTIIRGALHRRFRSLVGMSRLRTLLATASLSSCRNGVAPPTAVTLARSKP